MDYDRAKYKIWKLPHPLIIHWVVNPGLAINELLLGQRIPCVMLIDKTSKAPFMDRSYIPCDNCHALNDGRLWSKRNGFGHWFGYVCPECGGKIKCLWNITSLAVLVVTFPIWFWLKLYLEKPLIEKEKQRLMQTNHSTLPISKPTDFLKMGLGFAVLMFIYMNVFDLITQTVTLFGLAFSACVCLIAGVLFGSIMFILLGIGTHDPTNS